MARPWRDRNTRRWIAAWLGGPVLGIANGAFREAALRKRFGATAADRISAGSRNVLMGLYFAALKRRWPHATRRRALEVGTTWAGLTTAFEFLFGHHVAGQSWDELLAAYDIRERKPWPAVLLWIAAGPTAVAELDR